VGLACCAHLSQYSRTRNVSMISCRPACHVQPAARVKEYPAPLGTASGGSSARASSPGSTSIPTVQMRNAATCAPRPTPQAVTVCPPPS
jgi:hypothetical protein